MPFAAAGSVTLFSEAMAHGTVSWRADHTRRSLLYKYSAKHVAQGADAMPPQGQALSEAQRKLFRPPQENRPPEEMVFHPSDYLTTTSAWYYDDAGDERVPKR